MWQKNLAVTFSNTRGKRDEFNLQIWLRASAADVLIFSFAGYYAVPAFKNIESK